VFGTTVAKDSGSAARWDTDKGGEYFAVGIGGAVAGRRADLGLIDDRVRSREDADRDRGRERVWEWYVNDFETRLKPGSAQIIVMTRWHEDDLGGRVLQRDKGRWHVLRLPMSAGVDDPLGRKPGERLWPEWFTAEMMEDARRDVRTWNALYQQEPTGEDGDYFKRDWFREVQERPTNLAIYGASDYAVTEGRGDFTEHGIFGIDAWSNIYILDWWRDQAPTDVWIEAQCDLIGRYKPLCWFGESGTIRNAVEPFLARRMEERHAFCRLEWLPSIHDKPTRCRPFQALASSGKVFVPPVANWKADVLGQLLRFPAGMHDDSVDVCSLIGRGLEHVHAPEMADAIALPSRANVGYASAKRHRR
jgi:predicted phage terminase large subunit-like protein